MSSLSNQTEDGHILPANSEQVILDITNQISPEGWVCQVGGEGGGEGGKVVVVYLGKTVRGWLS